MTNILLLIIALLPTPSQDRVKFKLYYNDECRGSIWLNRYYYFTRLNDTVKIRANSKTGECLLPSAGVYKLYLLENEYPLTYTYHGGQADTINYPRVYFGISATTEPVKEFGYCSCETLLNGPVIEYFKKDHIRLKGNFKNGKLIGTMTYYDLNGEVAKTEQDPRKRKNIK